MSYLRDIGAREQRLHTELSAVLRELRDLRNDTQERAIHTVRHALVQHSPERISASFPGLSAEQLEATAAQLGRDCLDRAPRSLCPTCHVVRAAPPSRPRVRSAECLNGLH